MRPMKKAVFVVGIALAGVVLTFVLMDVYEHSEDGRCKMYTQAGCRSR